MKDELFPGDKVMVFDSRLYVDDVITPLSVTMKPATIVSRYGRLKEHYKTCDYVSGPYPDLIDVVFDHRPGCISKGHFTGDKKAIT